jgi:hypothetical protein
MSTILAFPRAPRRDRRWAALWNDLVRSWRHALDGATHESIDDATLRDLGISRSELGSFRAEADGHVPATRLRIVAAARIGRW